MKKLKNFKFEIIGVRFQVSFGIFVGFLLEENVMAERGGNFYFTGREIGCVCRVSGGIS